MTSLKLPKGVTYLQAHTAVVAREIMSETAFGQFCRKHGYLASTVDAWAEWFNNHPDAVGICQDTSKKLVRSLFTPEEPQQGLCPYASLPQDIF